MNKKIIIATIVSFLFLLIMAFVVIEGRRANFNTGYAPIQPIKFSHKIHAGENQINCNYCHYAAEKGRHAGIPPVALCMNCHDQIKKDSPEIAKVKMALERGEPIEWIKVNHFPDFAYFNHSQHVRVAKVSCQECHGQVQDMSILKQVKDLNMGWCIQCHRNNEIAPPADHKSRAGGDCARCHY